MTSLHWISPDAPPDDFPDVSLATRDPDGLLAIGGDLGMDRLLHAYRRGIFPWFNTGQPILWWSPDPRTILYPRDFRMRRSLARRVRQANLEISMDKAFVEVIKACAAPRNNDGNADTWISDDMVTAYSELHQNGWAHSVEVWLNGRLAGGLYGVAMGAVFFGESMFTLERDASKIALLALCRQLQAWNFQVIDCQIASAHLFSLGAKEISREQFVEHLDAMTGGRGKPGHWKYELGRQQLLTPLP